MNARHQPRSGKRLYGQLCSGEQVYEYTLRNRNGLFLRCLDYGGIITELHVPDRNGRIDDVVLGFDDLLSYENGEYYFGALIGRFAGRIANGQFSIGTASYELTANSPPNHLHGGSHGFDRALWDARYDPQNGVIEFTHVSPAGDQGYPGTLTALVRYSLTNNNELRVDYEAETDAATPVNLTQHSYFNLSGDLSSSVLEHELLLKADSVLELDGNTTPTGNLLSVDGSRYDFRKARSIASEYDDFWVAENGGELRHIATLRENDSGRQMKVYSTATGLQVYTSNFLEVDLKGKHGMKYGPRVAVCLEAQGHPDAPNHTAFPSAILEPGQRYGETTVFAFEASD
jgi:aldose 1-epimerase